MGVESPPSGRTPRRRRAPERPAASSRQSPRYLSCPARLLPGSHALPRPAQGGKVRLPEPSVLAGPASRPRSRSRRAAYLASPRHRPARRAARAPGRLPPAGGGVWEKVQIPFSGARKSPKPRSPRAAGPPRPGHPGSGACARARGRPSPQVPGQASGGAGCGSRALTEAADVEARGRPQRPARPALAQRLQMFLLALDQQDLLVDPAQEEGFGHGGRDLPVPELLRVLGFEVGEDLVADVVPGELPGLGRGRGLGGPGPLLRRLPGGAQDDGQRVRRDLQELLHLLRHPAPIRPGSPLQPPPAGPGGSHRNGTARQAGGVSVSPGQGLLRLPGLPRLPGLLRPSCPGRPLPLGVARGRAQPAAWWGARCAESSPRLAARCGPRHCVRYLRLGATLRAPLISQRRHPRLPQRPAAPAGAETREEAVERAGS
ncbi:translation initiation factor IF-2-like [Elephas maximus indicus]|uniref:translation initiation factor IF-2-like n=1 Tax=Elephas maximus indicus TaxID=99487 RepID=UPI002116EEC0|nr:translation initiation factor IF-2-like [Elephas maximus indicus]